ncbi:MAG: GDSL-type esterase/lipase family protein [Chitinophagaceae bacterium]
MKYKIFYLFIILLSIANFSIAQNVTIDTTYLSNVRKELRAIWPNNRTVNIVFHGHSVPAGYADNHEVHTLEAYPSLVLEKLKARYPFAPINIIVTAIGGENAIKGQTRFAEDVLLKKPDVILIDYALNDRGAGLEKSKEAWEKMIQEAIRQHVKIILLTPSPDQRVNITANGNDLEQHASQIRELAKKYKIGIADPFILFQKIIKDGGKIAEYMSSVNHPNKKGHDIIADEIMKWF